MGTRHIALIGMMCCGKSSVGQRMSEILGCPFFDLDIEIEKSTGKDIPSIFRDGGESRFRDIEYNCLTHIHQQDLYPSDSMRGIISCGGGTPTHTESRKYLKDNFFCIYLKTDADVITNRLEAVSDGCATRPMLFGHSIGERVRELLSKREEIYSETADAVIECGDKTIDEIAAEAIEVYRHFNFGLIGFPIRHSLSTALFNAAYGGKYTYDLIEYEDFNSGYGIFTNKCHAVNVTAPFKADALAVADNADILSQLAEACNILVHDRGRILGYNSDVLAVQRLIREHISYGDAVNRTIAVNSTIAVNRTIEVNNTIAVKNAIAVCHATENNSETVSGKTAGNSSESAVCHKPDRSQKSASNKTAGNTALVIGCGGAGRAAAVASLTLGMRTIIINRSIPKAEAFAQSISAKSHTPSTSKFSSSEEWHTPYTLNDSKYCESHRQRIYDGCEDMSELLEVRHDESLAQSVAESEIIIFTLPCPMPKLVKILEDSSTGGKVVIEANYRDPHLNGIPGKHKYIGGERWLEMQAIEGYELMTGKRPDAEAISGIIEVNH